MLKDYLLQGYALNQKRLKEKEQQLFELQKAVEVVSLVANSKALSSTETSGILEVLNQYSPALQVLDEYDQQQLRIDDTTAGQVHELTLKRLYNRSTYGENINRLAGSSATKKMSLLKARCRPSTRRLTGMIYTPAWKKRQPTCFTLW